jgi:hypothetical protein
MKKTNESGAIKKTIDELCTPNGITIGDSNTKYVDSNGVPVKDMPDKKAIVDDIYNAYGSDSGVLFGITERGIVEAIVEFTINRIK